MSAKKRREATFNHIEDLLDEALEESFPASDPAAIVAPGGGISGTEELPEADSRRRLSIKQGSRTAPKQAPSR